METRSVFSVTVEGVVHIFDDVQTAMQFAKFFSGATVDKAVYHLEKGVPKEANPQAKEFAKRCTPLRRITSEQLKDLINEKSKWEGGYRLSHPLGGGMRVDTLQPIGGCMLKGCKCGRSEECSRCGVK